jgi:hypothetical protein
MRITVSAILDQLAQWGELIEAGSKGTRTKVPSLGL